MDKHLKMYILVNEDIKINSGKLGGQTGHTVASFFYRRWKANNDTDIDEYMKEQTKIILFAKQNVLEILEVMGYITIRDNGKTDLPPDTLTCVNLGIVDVNNIPEHLEFIKTLKLVR